MNKLILTALCSISCLLSSCSTIPSSNYKRTIDRNNDGSISVSELESALVSVVFGVGDSDRDGKISFNEIKMVYPPARKKDFPSSDRDRSGFLSRSEMGVAMKRSGAFRKFLRAADRNGNRVIDQSEAGRLVDRMQRAQQSKNYRELNRIIDLGLAPYAQPAVISAIGRLLGDFSNRRYYHHNRYDYGYWDHRPDYGYDYPIFIPVRPIYPSRPIHNDHGPAWSKPVRPRPNDHGPAWDKQPSFRPVQRPSIRPSVSPSRPMIQPR